VPGKCLAVAKASAFVLLRIQRGVQLKYPDLPKAVTTLTFCVSMIICGSAHPVNWFVSWVQNDVNQFGLYL